MDDNIIRLEGISKSFRVAERSAGLKQAVKSLFVRRYKTVEALKDISLTVKEGEIVGYIGPNGAGKSTTIKVMSGVLVPDGGVCSVMGYTPWQDRVEYVRHIGVVFGQRSQLWWDVPVIDSFDMLKDIYRIPDSVYRRNLHSLTDMLGLDDIVNTPVRQLSLGGRMRCEIVASLLHDPKLLFLDEPTIGLDAVSKLAVRKFIERINKERGVTVILTTHDMSDIEALASRIVMIGKGELLFDGTLEHLKARFGTTRTVTVHYREHPHPIDIPGAVCLDWSSERAVYRFDAERMMLTDVISALSREVELLDMNVSAKGIDELIVGLYEEHRI